MRSLAARLQPISIVTGPIKVLLVDDMSAIRMLLGSLLQMVLKQGVTLFEAVDGVQALEIARRERPRLIVADISMPRMDGISLCEEIKKDPTLASASIVLMTSDVAARARGLAAGASAFLGKPINSRDLSGALRAALGTVA